MKKNISTSALLSMVILFASLCSGSIDNPKLIKLPLGLGPQRLENTPVMYQGRPLLIENSRLSNEKHGNTAIDMYVVDLTTSEILSRFGSTFAFNCAFVRGDELNVFATENTEKSWTGSIYRFWSTDLKTWQKELIMAKEKGRHFFNTSVCKGPDGYLMAYESNKPVQWCFQFARSNDLSHWEPIEELVFADKVENSCLANPTLRYIEPYYYLVYGIHRSKGKAAALYQYHRDDSKYFTFIMRSKDMVTWDLSPTKYPMIEPEIEDGVNASDADLFEFMGNTYLFYGAGWQDTRGTIRVKMYPGPMKECLGSYFDDNTPMIKFDASKGRYIYPDRHDSDKSVSSTTAKKPQKIVFVGDSISCGIGASSSKSRYTTVLTALLNVKEKKYKEVNLGISGSTLVDQLWPVPNSSGYPHSLAKALAEKPDIFVIQHGTNDNAVGASVGEFLWSYRQTVCTIKENLPQAKIVCMTICPSWGVFNSTREWLNLANIGIQEIAAFENTLLAHTNFKLHNRRELFPDGIHPNDEGHRIMAESVIEALLANDVKTKYKFDFICNGMGQHRICGYVFTSKAGDSVRDDGWICFRDFQKDGFTYISDYQIEITTPFKLYDKELVIKSISKDSAVDKLKGRCDKYRGCGVFSLPQTKNKEVVVKIDW